MDAAGRRHQHRCPDQSAGEPVHASIGGSKEAFSNRSRIDVESNVEVAPACLGNRYACNGVALKEVRVHIKGDVDGGNLDIGLGIEVAVEGAVNVVSDPRYVDQTARVSRRPPIVPNAEFVDLHSGSGDGDLSAPVLSAVRRFAVDEAPNSIRIEEIRRRDACPNERIVRGRLIGRKAEFEEARAFWSKARTGEGQFLLISGEPGIGKTRLTREIATHAEVSGGQALIGESYAEGGPPYDAFGQIVRKALGPHSETDLSLPEFVMADMLTLAPDLKQYYPDIQPNPALDPEAERQRLLENTVAFIRALAEQAPLLLVIDDAHWSDSGTLALLRHLSRRTRDLPVMLVATYREVELAEARPFNDMLLELNRQRIGTRIKLNRLGRADTQRLLEAIFAEDTSDDFVDAIYRETEGNPFYVEEVCKALIESGKIYYEDGKWQRVDLEELEVPQSIQVTIEARLAKLDESVLKVLRTAAILGREFEFDTLLKATGESEDGLIEALESAEESQLTHELGGLSGGLFSFAHALIPAALVEGLSGMRRRRLHKQAFAAIEALYPQEHSVLALHAVAAGEIEKALQYSLKAGDEAAAAYTWDEAQAQFQHAIEIAEELDRPQELISTYEKSGDAYASQGLLPQSIDAYQHALDLSSDKIQRAIINTKMGNLYILFGDSQGINNLELAKKDLNPKKHAPHYAQALVGIGRYYHIIGQHRKALEYFDKSRAIAEPLGDPALLWRIYAFAAGAYQLLAQYEESNKWANTCLAFGEEKNDLFSQAIGLEYLSQNANLTGHFEESLGFTNRELKIAEQIGDRNRIGWVLFVQGWSHGNLGNLKKTEEIFLEAIEIANESKDRRLDIFIRNSLCIALSHLGRFDEAAEIGLDSVRRAEDINQINMMNFSKTFLAYHYNQVEEWQKAMELLDIVEASLVESDARAILNFMLPLQTWAHWGLGELEAAAQKAEESLKHGKAVGAVQVQADAHCYFAQIYFSQDKWEPALESAEKAIALAAPEKYRIRQGRSLYWKAKILLAQDNKTASKEAADQALELFRYCGALPDSERTQKLLKEIG